MNSLKLFGNPESATLSQYENLTLRFSDSSNEVLIPSCHRLVPSLKSMEHCITNGLVLLPFASITMLFTKQSGSTLVLNQNSLLAKESKETRFSATFLDL